MEFTPVIGLEVHAQLSTRTKIFCGCSTAFGAPPNSHVCPVCLGMPGVLPVLNKKVVEFAIRMGLATRCRINTESRFARKNYFYPDLPKGYQISQYELPICEHGYVEIDVDGEPRRIGITRIHMEEDAGKLVHDPDQPVSRVDFNRTGVPLIEIVSEPDMRSADEAAAYLRKLHSILRYMGICDGNMEEGSFRCDANVSIMPVGSGVFGTRTELKNLNSFKHVEKAIQYEIMRQREVLGEGHRVIQETRLWNPDKGVTTSMRGKEEAHDYRYFPDPDLLPIVVTDSWVAKIRASLPELPDDKALRFQEAMGLSAYDAQVLTASRELADYFEAVLTVCNQPKQAANWVMVSLLGVLNATGKDIQSSPISPRHLGELLILMDEGVISGKIAKTVFDEMAQSGKPPRDIVTEKGLIQVSDGAAIASAVDRVIEQNPAQVSQYRSGKTKLFGFFVGQVMKETGGKANPQMVNEMIRKKLDAGRDAP